VGTTTPTAAPAPAVTPAVTTPTGAPVAPVGETQPSVPAPPTPAGEGTSTVPSQVQSPAAVAAVAGGVAARRPGERSLARGWGVHAHTAR
jgi:hypothetical protein